MNEIKTLPFTYDNTEVKELCMFVFILYISKHAFTDDLSKPLKSVSKRRNVASVSERFSGR